MRNLRENKTLTVFMGLVGGVGSTGSIGIVGCSGGSGHAAPDGGSGGGLFTPPTGIVAAPAAGATQLDTPPGTFVDEFVGFVAIGPSGEAFAAWQGTQAMVYHYGPGSSWSAPAVLDAGTGGNLKQLLMDSEGNATLALTPGAALWLDRYDPSSGWTPIQPSDNSLDTSSVMAAGGHGQLAVLETYSTAARLYDPSSGGWGSATILDSSAMTQNVTAYPASVAIDSSGTVMAEWASPSTGVVMYNVDTPGTGWATPAVVPGSPGATETLFADNLGNFAALSTSSLGQYSVQWYAQGAWGTPTAVGTLSADGSVSVSMGGGALALGWNDSSSGQPSASYVSSSSAPALINPPAARYPLIDSPRIRVDGQGRALMAWTESVGYEALAGTSQLRGPVSHVFYARYTPASGWTSAAQIDGDDGVSLGGLLIDVAVNEAGQAVAFWQGSGGLWVAPLP